MRKILRSIIRESAKQENAKPSRWLRVAFDTYQSEKYGVENRKVNQAKSTHKKSVWGSRIALLVSTSR